MAKYFTRTIDFTEVVSAEVVRAEDGSYAMVNTFEHVFPGDLTREEVQKKIGATRVIVSCGNKQELRGISIDEFVKNSKPMYNATTTQEEWDALSDVEKRERADRGAKVRASKQS